MAGPYYGKIPRRVAGLRLPGREHAVLDVIAVHTNRETGLALVGLESIARETGLHKRKVPARVLRLVQDGVLEIVEHGGRGVGGRGRANVYRIISDEEALRRASQAVAADDAAALNGALQRTESTTENGALFCSETVPFPSLNGALQGTPTERTESSTARAHTREGGSVKDQPSLLLPFSGGREAILKNDGISRAVAGAGSAEPSSERKRELFLQAVLAEAVRTLPHERYLDFVEAMADPEPPRWARQERERLARQMRTTQKSWPRADSLKKKRPASKGGSGRRRDRSIRGNQ